MLNYSVCILLNEEKKPPEGERLRHRQRSFSKNYNSYTRLQPTVLASSIRGRVFFWKKEEEKTKIKAEAKTITVTNIPKLQGVDEHDNNLPEKTIQQHSREKTGCVRWTS
jgi:hypothetical protein